MASLPQNTPQERAAKHLLEFVGDFGDRMYTDYAKWQLHEALMTRELTGVGLTRVDEVIRTLEPLIETTLASGNGLSIAQRASGINEILKTARNAVAREGKLWYKTTSEGHAKRLFGDLERNLTPGKGFKEYKYGLGDLSASYKGRIMKIMNPGDTAKNDFYRSVQFLSGQKEKTLQGEIVKRISRQADLMYLAPKLREAASVARNYPPELKAYVEHFFARALNLPSQTDVAVASVLQNTWGALQRVVGKKGLYDAYDVIQLAKTSNDLTYMGFLGLKPFSAMRNLFQPLILTPTDLGGIKNIGLIGQSYRDLTRFNAGGKEAAAALRKEIRAMGVIPEEITSEFGHKGFEILRYRTAFGKTLPQGVPGLNQIKAVSMWMFSGSHKINCYVTAAAAMKKWDNAFALVGTKRFGKFIQKAGIKGRDEAVRSEIEILLRTGKTAEARRTFVRSVVNDTQFTYTAMETPLVTSLGGGVGKTAAIFQTWWMQYGSTVHKWAMSGKPPSEKAQQAITAVFSAGTAYALMRTMWDHDVVKKTVLFGPFPSPGEIFRPPPVWKAVFEGIRMATTVGGLSVSNKPYSERVAKQMARVAKTTFPLVVPGGLQILQTGKRTGFPPQLFEQTGEENAFIKSIIRFKKPE